MTPAVMEVASPLALEAPLVALERMLDRVLPGADAPPESLHRAMRHAVFPAGKRVRPRLLLTVAAACAASDAGMELARCAACAVELVHCASLVHDDLPCFDDAALRRGQPTVHARYGEALAVLAGDALLCRAFDVLAEAPPRLARRSLQILGRLGLATGSREGIIGGQSLEGQAIALTLPGPLTRYHAMKTAALFRVAAEAGAIAAGATEVAAWGQVGLELGLAYQLLDDLGDVFGRAEALGKPVQKDAALGRPNAVLAQGAEATRERLAELLSRARKRIAELAVDPAPLHAFLGGLSVPAC